MSALIAGGSLLNGISGLVGAGAANRAARQARDFADRDLLGGQGVLNTRLYGSQTGYVPTWQRLLGEAQQHNDPEAARRYSRLIEEASVPTAGSLLGRMNTLADQVGTTQQADLARFDQDSDRLGRLYGSARDDLSREVGRINSLAAGAEGIARSTGIGRDRIIRRDASQQENAANSRSRAALAASGFGNSTAVGNAMRENAAAVGQQRDNALQANSDARLGAELAARSGRINTAQQGAGQVYGADVTGANAATARATNRLGLTQAHLANNQGLRSNILNTELGVSQTGLMNPSHPNPSAYYPGASGAGNALASFGNTATSAGGLLATLQAMGIGVPTSGQRNAFNGISDYMNIAGYAG